MCTLGSRAGVTWRVVPRAQRAGGNQLGAAVGGRCQGREAWRPEAETEPWPAMRVSRGWKWFPPEVAERVRVARGRGQR